MAVDYNHPKRAAKTGLSAASSAANQPAADSIFGPAQKTFNPRAFPEPLLLLLEQYGRFEFDPQWADVDGGALGTDLVVPCHRLAQNDPAGFLRDLAAVAIPVGGWVVYGAERLVKDVLTGDHCDPSYDAVMEASLQYLRTKSIPRERLNHYELEFWERHHPGEPWSTGAYLPIPPSRIPPRPEPQTPRPVHAQRPADASAQQGTVGGTFSALVNQVRPVGSENAQSVNWEVYAEAMRVEGLRPQDLQAFSWARFSEVNIEALTEGTSLIAIFGNGILECVGKKKIVGRRPKYRYVDFRDVEAYGAVENGPDHHRIIKYCIGLAGPGGILLGRIEWTVQVKRFGDSRREVMNTARERDRILQVINPILGN